MCVCLLARMHHCDGKSRHIALNWGALFFFVHPMAKPSWRPAPRYLPWRRNQSDCFATCLPHCFPARMGVPVGWSQTSQGIAELPAWPPIHLEARKTPRTCLPVAHSCAELEAGFVPDYIADYNTAVSTSPTTAWRDCLPATRSCAELEADWTPPSRPMPSGLIATGALLHRWATHSVQQAQSIWVKRTQFAGGA